MKIVYLFKEESGFDEDWLRIEDVPGHAIHIRPGEVFDLIKELINVLHRADSFVT